MRAVINGQAEPSKPIYLRAARERLGLTQTQLSQYARVAQNTISKLEHRAPGKVAHETVKRLARALGVDPFLLRFGPGKRWTRAARMDTAARVRGRGAVA